MNGTVFKNTGDAGGFLDGDSFSETVKIGFTFFIFSAATFSPNKLFDIRSILLC